MRLTIAGTVDEIIVIKAVNRIDIHGSYQRYSGLQDWDYSCSPEQIEFVVEGPGQWMTKNGEPYWYLDIYMDVECNSATDSEFDFAMKKAHNYFHTREEAEAAAEKIRAVLRGE